MVVWAEGFSKVGATIIILLAILMVTTISLDFLAGALGVRYFRASNRACWGAVPRAVVGLFWGLPGMLLRSLFGAFLGELSLHRELRPTGIAWLGLVLGTVAKVSIDLAMVGIFMVARCL